jgi:5-methylcytosine-specific restriction endonuclease McrA
MRPRRQPLKPKRSSGLRKIVRERSQGICAKCGRYDAKGESDHIQPLWCGGADTLSNLQWLCRRCHLGKTVGETPIRAKADRLAARAELTRQRRAIR